MSPKLDPCFCWKITRFRDKITLQFSTKIVGLVQTVVSVILIVIYAFALRQHISDMYKWETYVSYVSANGFNYGETVLYPLADISKNMVSIPSTVDPSRTRDEVHFALLISVLFDIAIITISLFFLLLGVLLINGAKNKSRLKCTIYIILESFLTIVGFICVIVRGFAKGSVGQVGYGCGVFLNLYFIWVAHSYVYELKNQNQPNPTQEHSSKRTKSDEDNVNDNDNQPPLAITVNLAEDEATI